MKKLSPFGYVAESDSEMDLPCLISLLERLVYFEEDRPMAANGPLAKRLAKAQNALYLLQEIDEDL